MDNQEALDAVRKERERLEASAFRLDDGRMVFKTEDGQRVVDQYGTELSRDTIDPKAIPDSSPRWESMKGIKD